MKKLHDRREIVSHLEKDPVLKKLIERYEFPALKTSENLFFDIIDSIVSQQLSIKAGSTILGRFKNVFNGKAFPNALDILSTPDEKIRECGMSFAKIKYIKGIAEAIVQKTLDLQKLYELQDEGVIEELTKQKGIGRWTAEMILIGSLGRMDVFSVGDLGLRTAVSRLYNVKRDDLKKIESISLMWKPYRTIASRYLWKSLDK